MKEKGVTDLVAAHGVGIVYLITGGFEHLVSAQGGSFQGFSMRGTDDNCLLVVRAEFEGVHMVAFIPGRNGATCLAKCQRQLRSVKLVWRPDRYKQNGAVKKA